MKNFFLFIAMGQIVFITACSGGSSSSSSSIVGSSVSSQPTKVVISFSLMSSQKLPFRMNGVEMAASLPAGVTVTATGSKIASDLAAGSAVSSGLVSGSFVAPKVKIMISDTSLSQSGFGPGEMARLTCSIAAGTTLSDNDRLAFENEISRTFIASGWDSRPTAVINPSPLKAYLQPRIVVTY